MNNVFKQGFMYFHKYIYILVYIFTKKFIITKVVTTIKLTLDFTRIQNESVY